MNKVFLSIFSTFTLFSLLACQKKDTQSKYIESNSSIVDFELVQENPRTGNTIKINSPKAIIERSKNNIQIFDSSIEIIDKNGSDIIIKSGNSNLINSDEIIRVFNNVYISLLNKENYFIRTNSLDWNLNTSNIVLDRPLDINFDNTIISSSNGIYNIDSNLLTIFNNTLNRSIFNINGKLAYQVEIKSDNAQWSEKDNALEFSSKLKQVETTIDFLSIK